MKKNFLGLVGLLLTSSIALGQSPGGEQEKRNLPRSVTDPLDLPNAAGQKSAAEKNLKDAGQRNSVGMILVDLTVLGAGATVSSFVKKKVSNSRSWRAQNAEKNLLEAASTGLKNADYNLFLFDDNNPGHNKGQVFANDLEALKTKAMAFGDAAIENELFEATSRNATLSTEDFKKALQKTDTAQLLTMSQEFKDEVKKFTDKYPDEMKKFDFLKNYLKPGDFNFEKLNNLKLGLASGSPVVDSFDIESARTNLNKASETVNDAITANRQFKLGTANKKIATDIRKLKKFSGSSATLKTLKAAGWAATGFIAVDVYGNILNYTSDNPKPVEFPGQLGAEILKGTPEAIFEAAKKAIEQRPVQDRGTIDELDPTTVKKNH